MVLVVVVVVVTDGGGRYTKRLHTKPLFTFRIISHVSNILPYGSFDTPLVHRCFLAKYNTFLSTFRVLR